MKNKIWQTLLLLAIFSYSSAIVGQKQTYIWYFGDGAGLDFSTTPPTTLVNSAMFAFEGCSSIADSNGKLLFYTDGIKAWNDKHQIMSNSLGLLGGEDVTQSALIVKKPKSSNIYYLFTVDGSENSFGIRYSEVDTKLDNEHGDIVSDKKNILLHTPVSEKIAATHHANGRDIWVITHGQTSNDFYAFLITPDSINMQPVISNAGSTYNKYNRFKGQMKVSIEGKKIACANAFLSNTELFDFDNQTGIVSNPISLPLQVSYGCEFSSDETKLYVSQANTYDISSYGIFQYNISSNNVDSILDSRILIETQSPRGFGSLQIGPNHKIYVARHNREYLGVINEPNLEGTLCNYDAFGIDLKKNIGWYGLPSFVSSYFRTVYEVTFELETECLADSNKFIFTGTQGYDSLVWNFGDNTTSFVSLQDEIKHHFEEEGEYTITLSRWLNGKCYTAKQEISLTKALVEKNEYIECEGFSVNVGTNIYTETGIYKDMLNDCDTIITILTIHPKPKFSLEAINDSCERNTGVVSAVDVSGSTPLSFLWNNGATDSILTDLTGGIYILTVTDENGCTNTDTIEVLDLKNDCNFFLFAPDAFSPNGDGLNDEYGVVASYLEKFDMRIFNIWGEQVFASKDVNDKWDGRYNGVECQAGIYTVVINYSSNAMPEQSLHYKTTLQLIR